MALKMDDLFDENENSSERNEKPANEDISPKESGQQPVTDAEETSDDDDFFEDDIIDIDKRRRINRYIIISLLIAVAIGVFFIIRSLFFAPAVSEGTMRGYAVLFETRKGIFDSYEGEFVVDEPDSTKTVRFSTTDKELGRSIYNAMHTDSLLVLDYKKYRKTLPWRGQSTLIVTGIEKTTPVHSSIEKPALKHKDKK